MTYTFAGRFSPQQFINAVGLPQPGLSVNVVAQGTSNLVALYTSRTKATGAANPFVVDSAGNGAFWADPGYYDLLINGVRISNILVPADADEETDDIATAVAAEAALRTAADAAEATARAAADTAEAAARVAADALLIPLTQRGAASGVATLDGSSKVPTAQLPSLAINETFVVASQAAMLALTAERGDMAVRTDLSQTFVLTADAPTVLGNWVALETPSGTTAAVAAEAALRAAADTAEATARAAAITALSGTYVGRLGGTAGTVAPLAYYNVKDYGSAGGGLVDDAAVINLALAAAAAAGGGQVFFPAGNYTIASALTLLPGVSIKGMGRNVTTIRARATFPINTALINLGDPAASGANDLVFHTRIEDMTLRCSNIAGSIGVYTNKANEQSGVFRVEISEYRSKGIYVDSTVVDPLVKPDNCSFEDLELICSSSATGSFGLHASGVVSKIFVQNVTANAVALPLQAAGIWLENCNSYLLNGIHSEFHTDGVRVTSTLVRQSGVIQFVENLNGTNVVTTGASIVVIGAADHGSTTHTINDTFRGTTTDGNVPFYCNFVPGNTWFATADPTAGILISDILGESNARFSVLADGTLQWGGGSGAIDLILKRNGAGNLLEIQGGLYINDSKDIVFGTSTGTKIGATAAQKLGFFGATPVVQQVSATQLRTALQNVGLLASGGTNLLNVVDADVNASAAIAESKLNLASDAAAGTASRRTIGTGALQATAGNDARLSDTRTPTALSVVDASVSASAAIAQTKLAGATLGYAQVTADQSSITTEVDLTSLSKTVTVGAGRRIKITGYTQAFFNNNAAATVVQFRIKEGATQLAQAYITLPANGGSNSLCHGHVVAILSPSTGSHTYKLTATAANSTSMSGSATAPAFILVEDIGT